MGDKSKFRVLVVDDDRDILDLLKYNLEKESYRVKTVEDSHEAIRVATKFLPDLIVLDLMMPHPNGIELCRDLRSSERFKDTYIFFLTAKSEGYYQQAALDTGGDDYIEKVVGLRSLTYKIKTVLQDQYIIRKSLPELRIGNFIIKRRTGSVQIDQREISLNKPEFELLFFLAQNPGRSIERESLLNNLWGSDVYLFDRSIDVYLQSITQKIGFQIIRHLTGNQYQFNA